MKRECKTCLNLETGNCGECDENGSEYKSTGALEGLEAQEAIRINFNKSEHSKDKYNAYCDGYYLCYLQDKAKKYLISEVRIEQEKMQLKSRELLFSSIAKSIKRSKRNLYIMLILVFINLFISFVLPLFIE